MKKIKYISVFAALFIALLPSCVEKGETPPPERVFKYGEIVTVQQIKALYADQLAISDYTQRVPVEITQDWALEGIITASDKTDGNLYKEAYIEDATGGIRFVFDATSGLYVGDSVIINVKGLFIGDYGNFWQVGGDPYVESDGDVRVSGMNGDNHVLKTSVGNPTYPATATLAQIKSAAYLGRLVTLNDVQFTDEMYGLTWADSLNATTENRDLEDCTTISPIVVRTSGFAQYANKLLPAGKGSITGIVTIFSGTYQFIVRDIKEVNMTGDRCGYVPQPLGAPVETLSQNFTGMTAGETIYITGWQNLAQTGNRQWSAKAFSGNTYAQVTGYNSNLASMITWFITQPVTLTTQKVLSFQSAMAYWAHETTETPLEVFYSTDYNGTNLTTATWVKLSPALAVSTDTNYAFINSGNINLPVEAGKSAVIAFRYTGSNTKSTTFCIDNIVVSAAK